MLSDKDLLKLRTPLHVKYISKHLLKTDIQTTQSILSGYLDEGILKVKNDYYVLKNKNNV
jgi:hypothetical protein